MDLSPGTNVDKYVVEELLGRGGMASVYRIRHESLRSVHALKVLDLPSRQIRERLQSEGMYQANLRHPNVVSVVDVVVVDGNPALVMEYVDGPSLEQLLRVHRPTLDQIDEVARGILKGVRAAHRVGLIHRDLKPANILMARSDDGFVPKIADFGLAKMVATDGSDAGRTRTGAMMGTPAYMAPEQFRSAKEVDERADVYALGVTLYELCTGRRPVQSDDLFDIYEQVKAQKFPRPRELVPDLPERMETAILGALVIDPGKRLATVDALYATWVGLSELASDRAATWDRDLLDSVTRSASGGGRSDEQPITFQTMLPSDLGSMAPDPPAVPERPRPFARRAAPFVAVMGLAFALLLAVQTGSRTSQPDRMTPSPAVNVVSPRAPAPVPAAAPAEKKDLAGERELGLADRASGGTVTLVADGAAVTLVAEPVTVQLSADRPTAVPAGSWRLIWDFGDGPTTGPSLAVTDGSSAAVTCVRAESRCVVTP